MTSYKFKYLNYDHKRLLYMWAYGKELCFFDRLRLSFYNWWTGTPIYREGD